MKLRSALVSKTLSAQGLKTQLDQYTFETEVDQGQCNTVVIGQSKVTGVKVAIKAIPTEKYQRLAGEHNTSEAEAMNLCQKSDYIVSLVDHFEIGDTTYLVSKYAQGGDLFEYCLRQPDQNKWMSEHRARHIIQQIAKGVRDMHKKSLVHFDLKLLNVFVSSNSLYPKIKIGDLGLTSHLEGDAKFEKCCGTLAFMSPEMVQKLPTDSKSDIWSLGIILYSMIGTKHPFTPVDSKKDLQRKICTADVNF